MTLRKLLRRLFMTRRERDFMEFKIKTLPVVRETFKKITESMEKRNVQE